MFFQFVSHRYERSSVIITSYKSFGDSQELFGDVVIATAILDRLLHNCKVVNIKGDSHRLRKHALAKQAVSKERTTELSTGRWRKGVNLKRGTTRAQGGSDRPRRVSLGGTQGVRPRNRVNSNRRF